MNRAWYFGLRFFFLLFFVLGFFGWAEEENQSACPSCTLSDLLKQPSLFFKSLRQYKEQPDQLNSMEYQHRLLSVRLFGAYSSDLEEDNYILTIDVERQEEPFSPFDKKDFDKQEELSASGLDMIKNAGALSYKIKLSLNDSLEKSSDKDWAWSGSASYRIAKIHLHDIFLTGGVSSDSAVYSLDPLWINQPLSGVRLDKKNIPPDADQQKEYLTYEMGVRIERDEDIFLNVSAFETGITNEKNPDVFHIQPVDSQQPSSIQGVEVRVGFLLKALEGGAQYIYTQNDDQWFQDAKFVRHLGALRLGYTPTSNLVFGTVYTHRGRDLLESDQSVAQLDIYSFYDIHKNTRMGLVLQNVTDEPYEYRNFRYERSALFAERERTLWLRLEIQ